MFADYDSGAGNSEDKEREGDWKEPEVSKDSSFQSQGHILTDMYSNLGNFRGSETLCIFLQRIECAYYVGNF